MSIQESSLEEVSARRKYVFIVGCARTGTTLLRQILTKSERVCIAPETHYVRRFTSKGSWRAKHWDDLADDANLDRLIDFMYSGREAAGSAYWNWLQRNVEQQSFRERVRASGRTERGIFNLLMQIYAEKTRGQMTDDIILGEKTPSHFNYIPTLLEWFPRAKIIHTFRDPRAILVSELKKMRKKGKEGPKRIFGSVPSWILEPLELPVELIHTTRSWLDAARVHALAEERYPDNYTLVRFEDLVTQPESQIRRLCNFLEIPFAPAMVIQVQVVGSSYQQQHRGAAGFDPRTLERWKSSLHPALNIWFAFLGGKQMKKFGYA